MSPPQPTARIAWIARCLWRLKRLYGDGKPMPGGDRCLSWSEYTRLVSHVLAEYGKEE